MEKRLSIFAIIILIFQVLTPSIVLPTKALAEGSDSAADLVNEDESEEGTNEDAEIVTEEVTVGDSEKNNDVKDENKNVDKTVNDENENNKVEEELEDQTPPITDDAVENNEPTEEKANSPPAEAANEEVEEAGEEVNEEDNREVDELVLFTEGPKDLGNIFEDGAIEISKSTDLNMNSSSLPLENQKKDNKLNEIESLTSEKTGKIRITKANYQEPPLSPASTYNNSDYVFARLLEGAVFEIKDSNGTVVDTITTNKEGYAESKELNFGKYTVLEIKAPKGYKLDDKEYKVNLGYKYKDIWVQNRPVDPEIEKDINGKDHEDLMTRDQVFIYNVKINIPSDIFDLSSIFVTDTLEDVLEIKGMKVLVDGEENEDLMAFIEKKEQTIEFGFYKIFLPPPEPLPDTAETNVYLSNKLNKELKGMKFEEVAKLAGKELTLVIESKIKENADLSKYKNGFIPNKADLVVNDNPDTKKETKIVTVKVTNYAIGNYVWVDSNGNGIQDENELGLPNVKVELYDEDESKIAETETDDNGRYIFDELPAGKYKVKFTLTKGQANLYQFTKENAGNDATVDSDVDPKTGWTKEILLDESNEYLVENTDNQMIKATQGIDSTWDAGVVLKKISLKPAKTAVAVEKVWIGGKQEKVTINLLADGEVIDSADLSDMNDWKHTFIDLPTVHEITNEKVIEYTVEEVAVEGYEATITGSPEDGFVITNTRESELVDVEGLKTWEDANNQEGKRPESIIVRLLANGEEVDHVEVTVETDWSFEFTGLPKFKNGEVINYNIQEDEVEDYSTEIDGFNITNSYTPDQISINVVKAWDDANNQDGKRPDSITVKLFADGIETGKELVLNEANNWQGDFTDLDVKKDGEAIVYSVEEAAVDNYETEITGTPEDGFVITNTYELEPTIPEDPEMISPDEPEKSDDVLPKTATNMYTTLLIGTLVLSSGIVLLFFTNRRRNDKA